MIRQERETEKIFCVFIAFIQMIRVMHGGLKSLNAMKAYERERESLTQPHHQEATADNSLRLIGSDFF